MHTGIILFEPFLELLLLKLRILTSIFSSFILFYMLVHSFNILNIPVIALEFQNVVCNLCCSWQCLFAKYRKANLPNMVERLHTFQIRFCLVLVTFTTFHSQLHTEYFEDFITSTHQKEV